eukprot:1158310-Pelagomonas_calceolata.AAC.7
MGAKQPLSPPSKTPTYFAAKGITLGMLMAYSKGKQEAQKAETLIWGKPAVWTTRIRHTTSWPTLPHGLPTPQTCFDPLDCSHMPQEMTPVKPASIKKKFATSIPDPCTHLVDPSQGPWKGTIQVTPTGFTSESTFRESPGRLSLGPYQGLETASAVRPGAAGELPPAAVPMNGPSPFAGMQGRMSHPGYQDTLLDSYPYAMVSLTATHPIQTSTVSLNGVGTARYAGG